MQISNNYNTKSFKALDYSKVHGEGLKLVKEELPKLEELGKKYDIKLASMHDNHTNAEYLDVCVDYLNRKSGILKRLRSLSGWAYCRVGSASVTDIVNHAIARLK